MKKYWQIIKPNSTDKALKAERTPLFGGVNIIPEEKDAVKRFKDLFEIIAETLKIDHSTLSDLIDDPVVNSRIFPKFFLNFFN